MNDSISVIEPESQPSPLRLCVVRDADIDRDIELAVVAEEIRDIPIVQQALGMTFSSKTVYIPRGAPDCIQIHTLQIHILPMQNHRN